MHTEISSETHHSANTGDNYNICDTTDEDPRPAKRRKPRSAPTVTTPLHLRQSRPRVSHSATSVEIDDARPRADCGYRSTLVDDEHHYTPRTSRSPPAPAKSAPVAEYQSGPSRFLQAYQDRQRDSVESRVLIIICHEAPPSSCPSEALGIRSNKEASAEVGTSHSAVAHSEARPATLRPKRKRVPWESEENETILKMKKEGYSWEEIHHALPDRTPGAIQVQSTPRNS
ncbi:hypothetical protein BKA61DRAFT_603193 [Leptodontidium sp. MPI-SDFR-AT-0119]|nr:hypothetical protein BKA61DRAFT_603193 [Leptodontidium sp. MPI-SDFR-AT-0119]